MTRWDDHMITKAQFEKNLLLQARDPHAHARIDALQKVIASLEELHGIDPGAAKARMAEADKAVEKELGLR